jgi:apolipoprotein N-acyltransferase
VEQGAQAILVPTMDAAHWGARQHDLHARIAPVRAAEYGVPVVRVCSSGISQIVEEDGWVQAEAPFPGFGSTIAGTVAPVPRGHLPPDRWLAPLAVAVTAAWIAWLFVRLVRRVQPA